MKLKLTLICLFIGCSLALQAQDYKVIGMESLPTDMTAREHIKTDENGKQCAVLRIATQNITPEQREGFFFESDWGSYVVERSIVDGEIWLWVSPGLKTLKIRHGKLGRWELHTANYGITVEALHVYKVVIQGTMASQFDEQPVVTQQYLAFQIWPANAMLEVNGELWEVAPDGSAMRFVDFGTYNYRVQAPNHQPKTGTVTVNDPENTQKVPITLISNYIQVTFQVDSDAEIWVNNERKGVRIWRGALGKGNYRIECKQAGHETTTLTQEITADMAGQTINLPMPKPIYGSLNIESMPNFATIYVDGERVGETPKYISQILVDEHELKLTKDGFADYEEIVHIKKGERKQVRAILKKKEDVQLSISNTMSVSDDQTFTVNGVSFTMKLVEGGTFYMGATPEQGKDVFKDESPVHSVTLNSYYLGETEVTQALWEAVMGSNPSNWKGDNLPVERISWNDCQEFIYKLNQMTGKFFRLPSEAEWEYAARGGKKSEEYRYAGSNIIANVGWCKVNSRSRTNDVKTKVPNELGLYDMNGNVWEWCQDWYGSYIDDSQTNPQGPRNGSYRVLRGGCWNNEERICRVSSRNSDNPINKYYGSGLRLCLSE